MVVGPNASLVHPAALPILVGDRDAVCCDVLVDDARGVGWTGRHGAGIALRFM